MSAALRLGVDYRWVGAYALVLSGLTYWVYAVDKRRAEEGLWRKKGWLTTDDADGTDTEHHRRKSFMKSA